MKAVSSAQTTQNDRTNEAIRQEFKEQLDEPTNKINATQLTAPQRTIYEDVKVVPGILCDELLDAVKCIQELTGTPYTYVS